MKLHDRGMLYPLRIGRGLGLFLLMTLSGCTGGTNVDLASHDENVVLKTHEEKWGNGNVKDRYTYYLDGDGAKVRHAKSVEWFENGQRRLELEYSHGKLNGGMIEWYPDSQMAEVGAWKKNQKEGTWTKWHPLGDKAWECTYAGGLIIGQKTYWSDGKVIMVKVFDEKGNRTETTQWHENGKKSVQGTFTDNKKHGTWTYWDYQGKTKARGEWKDGKPWDGLCAIPAAGDAGSWAGITRFVRYKKGMEIEE